MNLMWPVVLAVARIAFGLYTLWCLLFPIAVAGLLYAVGGGLLPLDNSVGYLIAAALVIATALVWGVVWARRTAGDPIPFQSALLSWFGSLKWFWLTRPGDMVKLALPSGFLVENPGGYALGGPDTRKVLDLLQPGDILLRGYRGYIDGFMIRLASRCSASGFKPGWFTHAALYVGPLHPQDLPAGLADDQQSFQAGTQMVIHSMARGVHCEDVLTFLRCDYLTVLRLKADGSAAMPTDYRRADAIAAARHIALQSLGSGYNFNADGSTEHHRFSCSELVCHCLASVQRALGLQATLHAIYPFPRLASNFTLFARTTIAPDDFYELAQNGLLDCKWEDAHSQTRHAGGKA